MGSGFRNWLTCVGALLVLCCAADVCCSAEACCQTESDCSACACPAGECPTGCQEKGCQSDCCNKTAALPAKAVLVVDVDLLAPSAPVTLTGLLGGALPSDLIAELATNPTGLAGCCQGKCDGAECAKSPSALPTAAAVTTHIWKIRNLLENVPHCTVEFDSATFSLMPAHATEAMAGESNIVLAKFNQLEHGAEPCCCCKLRAAARQQAAQQLTEIAASLEKVELTDQAARARQFAEELSALPSHDTEVEVSVEVAEPAQDELLR